MPKASPKVAADLLASRIESSSARVSIPISYLRYKSVNSDCVVDLTSSGKCAGCVRAHRFYDLMTTEADYKPSISARHSLVMMSLVMRLVSVFQILCRVYSLI